MKTIEEKIRLAAKRLIAVRITGRSRSIRGFRVIAKINGVPAYTSQSMPAKKIALAHLLATIRCQPKAKWELV